MAVCLPLLDAGCSLVPVCKQRRELEELTIQNQKKGLPFPHLEASPSEEKSGLVDKRCDSFVA